MYQADKESKERELEAFRRVEMVSFKADCQGTSLVVERLRLHAPSAGGLGLNPGQETRSRMLQLRVCMPQ